MEWIKTEDALPEGVQEIVFFEWCAEQICGRAYVGMYLSDSKIFESDDGIEVDADFVSHWASLGDLCELKEITA